MEEINSYNVEGSSAIEDEIIDQQIGNILSLIAGTKEYQFC